MGRAKQIPWGKAGPDLGADLKTIDVRFSRGMMGALDVILR